MLKKSILLILAVVLVFAMVACTAAPAAQQGTSGKTDAPKADAPKAEAPADDTATSDAEPFKFGISCALTGTNGHAGEALMESVNMYVEELNARGGLNGRPVQVISYDDANAPEEAVKCATKLVEVDKVDAAFAGFASSCVLANGAIFEKAEIPFFIGGLSPSLTSQGWKYVVRTALNTNNNIPALPGILKALNLTKIAMFLGQDEYGTTCGENMKAAAEANGIAITTTESYVSGDTDFSGQVNKIIASEPDAVFLGAVANETGTLVKQLRQYGWSGLVFGSELINTAQLEIAAGAGDYMMFAYPYVVYDNYDLYADSNAEMKEFQDKFYKKYNKVPVSDCAYRGWDAFVLLEKAVNETGSTNGKDIVDAIYKMSNVKSLSGFNMDFTKTSDGDCMFEFNYYIIKDNIAITMDQWRATDDFKEYAAAQGWTV